MPDSSQIERLVEVAAVFLKLGFTAFGGPAAHIAFMHDEVVKRRRWVDEQRFLDLLGATNLIPGPNSTEMTIHLGFLRAGWPGLIVGGACFILPAMLIVMALAWVYVRFGSTPQAGALLYGIKPVVIAIILAALWGLGRQALKGPLEAVIGLVVFILYFLGVNEIALLLGSALLVMLVQNARRLKSAGRLTLWALAGLPELRALAGQLSLLLAAHSGAASAAVPFSLWLLFLTFLKIGSVLYGSGYVLLAFLRADFVTRLGWLTDQQLLDAVAIGQVTPGPLFTTATFIGYLLGGVPGGLLATLGIFLPAFIFVAVTNPVIPRLRQSPWAASLLDGVIAASLGLMAAVTWQIARASLVDPLTLLVAAAAAFLLFRYKTNSTWLIAAGAAVGIIKLILGW